ncbi:hypothetical protein SISSUDRAFT_974548, partial [Sistotremastrum suecicum HHB10207 ss-3]
DGHGSHDTWLLIYFCEKRRIAVICLPPHTTHALQPCDVGAFGPLSLEWKKRVIRLSSLNIEITKENFIGHYTEVRAASLKPKTILSAWARTGIHPYNP